MEINEWVLKKLGASVFKRIKHIYKLGPKRRAVIASPFIGCYIAHSFVDTFGASHCSNSICLETPITFLNKLRYRQNYIDIIEQAIDEYTYGIDYMNSNSMYNTNNLSDYYVASNEVILYFLVLCYNWLIYHHSSIDTPKQYYFDTIVQACLDLVIMDFMAHFEGDYKNEEDLIELIKINYIDVCECSALFSDEIF
jgi:hypothetical protein